MAGSTTQSGVVQGVPVFAEKGLNVSANTFSAWVWSHALSNIGTIGWTWWTVRQYCPDLGTYPVNYQFGGDANYNTDSDYSASNHYVSTCNNLTKEFQNLGTHDFKNGSDVWRPLVNYFEDY